MSMTHRDAAELACERLITRVSVLRNRIKTVPPGTLNYFVDELVRDLEAAGKEVVEYTRALNESA